MAVTIPKITCLTPKKKYREEAYRDRSDYLQRENKCLHLPPIAFN